MPRRLPVILLVLGGLGLAPAVRADEGAAPIDPTQDGHLEAALEAAGENRVALEHVLAVAARHEDPRRLVAARFLISNMVGHGYIVTALRSQDGAEIEFDPLAHKDFKASLAALDALEAKHGELTFDRSAKVLDLETITADFLLWHIRQAFEAWAASPADRRVDFGTFLAFVLPYRGSQEPVGEWIGVLRTRYDAMAAALAEGTTPPSAEALYRALNKDVHRRVRFNERYYLHPTDQGFAEMEESGQGRCEDITNMITWAARSQALATAADYTPAWGHRDNNHAWNVLLDRAGQGSDAGNAHAAKVYRKTYALQRDNLAFRLPAGREAPNRFLASRTYVDVTPQYGPTTDVTVALDPAVVGSETFAYLCVFNGGRWTAIHWGAIEDGRVTFTAMGRNLCYLPAIHDGTTLIPAAAPRLVHRNGTVRVLDGEGASEPFLLTADFPRKKSPDTHVVTPRSRLKPGETYTLKAWRAGQWRDLITLDATEDVIASEPLDTNTLYWLVRRGSRRLERIFTIQEGQQRFW